MEAVTFSLKDQYHQAAGTPGRFCAAKKIINWTTHCVKKFVASFSYAVTSVTEFVEWIVYMAKCMDLAKSNVKEFLFVDMLVAVSVGSHAYHVKGIDV